MTTTAGSLALEGSIPPRDAFVAARLREAGAVLLGKTNLSEWANFRSTHSSSGWSGRGGQCRNPYALDRNPSGSSSGSAAASAANLCAVAVGTETDGSIVSPSNDCGLVGIKPTVGLAQPRRHDPDLPQPGHGRPHGPHRRRRRAAARRHGGRRPARRGDLDERGGKAQPDYTKFLDPEGLAGRAHRRPAQGSFGQSPAADRSPSGARRR